MNAKYQAARPKPGAAHGPTWDRAAPGAGLGRRPLGIFYLSWIYFNIFEYIFVSDFSLSGLCLSLERLSPMQSYCRTVMALEVVASCLVSTGQLCRLSQTST